MASCNLDSVLNGCFEFTNITKQQFEIVITRFNESLEWTRGFEHLCTVYNKGAPFHYRGQVIDVPNYGVGCETILRHVRDRYWRLADVTLFCQATLCDRQDQPMYPLTQYMKCPIDSLVGNKDELNDIPNSRYCFRISNENCKSIGDRNLGQWREMIGLPYKVAYESWVKGDWISVGRLRVQKRPWHFYKNLYSVCEFERGILVEECWFLERTFYSMFAKI